MDIAELSVEILKQRARAGDREALQALRERGFFQSRATVQGFPASHTQRRLWVSAHKDRDGDAYVISLALRLRGPLRQTELQHAMETLYVRHETLRTRFVEHDGELRQFYERPVCRCDW
jgi:Condensation domain